MKLVTAISDSENNILAGHSAHIWGFKKDDVLRESIVGDFITFWCSEKDNKESQSFIGLGIITGPQVRGKIKRNVWQDSDYYGEIPFKTLSLKKILLDQIRKDYGTTWSRLFTVNSSKLPVAQLSDELLKKFILSMLIWNLTIKL